MREPILILITAVLFSWIGYHGNSRPSKENDIKEIDSLKSVIEKMSWHHVDTMIVGKYADTILSFKIGRSTYEQ